MSYVTLLSASARLLERGSPQALAGTISRDSAADCSQSLALQEAQALLAANPTDVERAGVITRCSEAIAGLIEQSGSCGAAQAGRYSYFASLGIAIGKTLLDESRRLPQGETAAAKEITRIAHEAAVKSIDLARGDDEREEWHHAAVRLRQFAEIIESQDDPQLLPQTRLFHGVLQRSAAVRPAIHSHAAWLLQAAAESTPISAVHELRRVVKLRPGPDVRELAFLCAASIEAIDHLAGRAAAPNGKQLLVQMRSFIDHGTMLAEVLKGEPREMRLHPFSLGEGLQVLQLLAPAFACQAISPRLSEGEKFEWFATGAALVLFARCLGVRAATSSDLQRRWNGGEDEE